MASQEEGGAPDSLVQASQHTPNLAGSVITADGLGNEKLCKFLKEKQYACPTCLTYSRVLSSKIKSVIRIQNMSATANLGIRLDLKKIALKCRNCEFNPRRFGAVIMRLRDPRATALIFASGKMVVTGVKSTHNATLAAKKFAYIVERVGKCCNCALLSELWEQGTVCFIFYMELTIV